ncbi:MAG: DNA methylase [Lachnospiraceae bacterium]|nr:DNA methylase [Lachnospiraceae bacterium]
MESERYYIAIDLKSFYASVECADLELNPLTTNLVVADRSRTEKTICLAVSPSLKEYGIPGRARLFEVEAAIRKVNEERKSRLGGSDFSGGSSNRLELAKDPSLKLEFITAVPRMARYMEISTAIYNIYLNYVAPEDIHVYSIDEVFMDVTGYLDTYGMTPHELAMRMIKDVLELTNITATAGIGTNLYLCKVAMDIVAKHSPADKDGVRIAELDESSYRKLLWGHRPITDFWRVGRGIAKKLEQNGMYTMGDIARCSLGRDDEYHNEDLLYSLFGVNAELLIDHAWGYEPCTISDIKSYRPSSNSLGSGQVLKEPYDNEKARLVVWEMTDLLALDLVNKHLVTDQLVLMVGYDVANLDRGTGENGYSGEVTTDYYGRKVPKHAHGSVRLSGHTSSSSEITGAMIGLYDRIVDKDLLIRRIGITANNVMDENKAGRGQYEQMDLFSYFGMDDDADEDKERLDKEKRIQNAVLDIKKKYGKNAILKGANFLEGATARERNSQIGGHRS